MFGRIYKILNQFELELSLLKIHNKIDCDLCVFVFEKHQYHFEFYSLSWGLEFASQVLNQIFTSYFKSEQAF